MRIELPHTLLTLALIYGIGSSSASACHLGMKMAHTQSTATAAVTQAVSEAENLAPHEATAVGLWQSTFAGTDGSTFVGFETIYADGNELLIDNSAPATDNVCSGVWEQIGPRTYKINHPSWDFDLSGNLIGVVVLIETITIDERGNKFKGTETVTVYDPTVSTIIYQVSGTLTGARITARSKPL